ncbi:MAG: adenylate/guanylate cyclase domain-containing protein [Bacteroidota bacterium]
MARLFNRLSPSARINIVRILPFGIIWLIFDQIFFISDYSARGDFGGTPETAIQLDLSILIFGSFAVTIVGLLVGTVEVIYLNRRFTTKTLAQKVIYKTLFYSVLLLGVILITFPIAVSMELNTSLLDGLVWERLKSFMFSTSLLNTVIQLSTMLVASLFYSEISEHIGHGVLVKFLTGRYHTPKEETRIFMFSDMKDSTRIAEQLGHGHYFKLLRAYYQDLSHGIMSNAGQIYQYVGDEVVVSWPVESGLRDNNCINCFFVMKADLTAKAEWYRQEFGVAPDFKAGLHIGDVTTGEIGALKKEIIFTGDILNATARIQGLCNKHEVDLLVSGDLLSRLQLDTGVEVESLGQCELRGKTKRVELHTIKSLEVG